MPEMVVIADDLTGAADTGIQFRKTFSEAHLISVRDSTEAGPKPEPEVISIYTNTRALSGTAARGVLENTAQKLRQQKINRIYKKIDSCLRGNIGPEIEALLDAFGYKAAFIAPAFPAQGRTTVHDVHLVHGIPVAETEIGRDPVRPVKTSSLSGLIAEQSRYPVGHVDLSYMDAPLQKTAAEVDRLIHAGCKHIAFDTVHQHHLDKVAEMALTKFTGALPVGSAGLAQSLTTSLSGEAPAPPPSNPHLPGNLLMICGTTSERMLDQVQQLIRKYSFGRLLFDPSILAAPDSRPQRQNLARRAAERLARENLIFQIQPSGHDRPAVDPDAAAKGLAELTAGLTARTRPGGLFLSGGDTAGAVLEALKIKALRLESEILPGLVRGTIIGGDLNDLLVVTKAGAFGEPDTLVRLYQLLKSKG